MPYKVQIFDREKSLAYGEIPVADEEVAEVVASLSHIQQAARLAIAGQQSSEMTSSVFASLVHYEVSEA